MTEYLNALPAELRAVVIARYVDGLNERETARLLGITRYHVRTRHAQALAILRRELYPARR